MNKRWFRTLFRRRILISLLIVLQAALVVWFIVSTSQVSVVVRHILHIISFVAVLAIVAFIIYKLVKKYTEDLVYDCDDLLDECNDCDVAIEDADDDIVEA